MEDVGKSDSEGPFASASANAGIRSCSTVKSGLLPRASLRRKLWSAGIETDGAQWWLGLAHVRSFELRFSL
jgi:hypothetical protein